MLYLLLNYVVFFFFINVWDLKGKLFNPGIHPGSVFDSHSKNGGYQINKPKRPSELILNWCFYLIIEFQI